MRKGTRGRPSFGGISKSKRRAIRVSGQELVRRGRIVPDKDLPLLVEPTSGGVDLASWASENRAHVAQDLGRYGGILFRGFDLAGVDAFQRAIRALSGEPLEYTERSSPRHSVGENIYTSTDYPPDQPIYLHNENSYQQAWPLRIFFFCETEPTEGGETPIADVRKVYRRIPPEIRERFREKQWMYVRNFGDGFGLEWQTVFGTGDREQVKEYCKSKGIQWEWKGERRLRTHAVRPAVVRHPEDGEWLWFNHATFFHFSTLTEGVRAALLREFAEEDLPTNTYYGDGTPIEPEVVDELRRIYDDETVAFPWRKGDLLLLDNMKVAHGRAPFHGDRKILVAMADPCTWDQVEQE